MDDVSEALLIWKCIFELFTHSTNNFEYDSHFSIMLGMGHTEISNSPALSEPREAAN